MVNSDISGFYKLSIDERLKILKEQTGLSDEEIALLANTGALAPEFADRMIENVVGVMPLTLGIATNFQVNGKDYLVPMAIEEPSVVAAASNSAKAARASGGFKATATEPVMIGQIQLTKIEDAEKAKSQILAAKEEFLEKANSMDPMLVKLGGGARDARAGAAEPPPPGLRVFLAVDQQHGSIAHPGEHPRRRDGDERRVCDDQQSRSFDGAAL